MKVPLAGGEVRSWLRHTARGFRLNASMVSEIEGLLAEVDGCLQEVLPRIHKEKRPKLHARLVALLARLRLSKESV